MEMETVKVQITKQNIEYKKVLGISFAQLVNTLIQLSAEDPYIQTKLLDKIPSKSKKDK